METPLELKKAYLEGRVVPFVGAGVSASVEWTVDEKKIRGPSWRELVDQATTLMKFDDPTLARVRGTDLQILEYFKRKNGGQTAKLTNWLATLMTPPIAALEESAIHSELSRLDKCKIFYTTNFDNFLERSLELEQRKPRVVAVEMDMGFTQDGCEVVKFHGDLDHPSEIVLTELDYERRLSLSHPLDYRLRADLLGRVVLFIGYSFRDPNVSYLFRLFKDDIVGKMGSLSGPRAYIVVPDPSDFEYTLFGARDIQIIPVKTNSMATDIAHLLRDIRG